MPIASSSAILEDTHDAARTTSRGGARPLHNGNERLEPQVTTSLIVVLQAHYPDQADEIYASIRPLIADDAIAMATTLLSDVFARLALSPRGEALRHILGLAYTCGTLRATARKIGCSPEAINQHCKAIRPLFANTSPPALSTNPRSYRVAPHRPNRKNGKECKEPNGVNVVKTGVLGSPGTSRLR